MADSSSLYFSANPECEGKVYIVTGKKLPAGSLAGWTNWPASAVASFYADAKKCGPHIQANDFPYLYCCLFVALKSSFGSFSTLIRRKMYNKAHNEREKKTDAMPIFSLLIAHYVIFIVSHLPTYIFLPSPL